VPFFVGSGLFPPEKKTDRLGGAGWIVHVAFSTSIACAVPASLASVDCNFEVRRRIVTDSDRIWILAEGYLDESRDSRCDTAPRSTATAIASLVSEQGYAAVEGLSGCFIAAIVFPQTGRIIVFRDRVGGRTAYWYHTGDAFGVATSSSLLAQRLPEIGLNAQWLAHWFGAGWPIRPALTPFSGIHELLPGERLEFADGRVKRHRRPFEMPEVPPRALRDDWVERFRTTFADSVNVCLPEHDDVAVMLSGGMDSGPVAAVAARSQHERGRSLTAVSWSLPAAPNADESDYIRKLAGALEIPLDLFDAGDCVPYDRLSTDLVVADFPTFNFYREMILRCYERAAARGLRVILNAAKGDLIYPPRSTQLADLWTRRDALSFARFIFVKLRTLGLSGTWQDANFRHFVSRLLTPLRRRESSPPEWLTPYAAGCQPDRGQWPPEASSHRLPEYASHLIGQAMAWGIAHENLFSQRFGVERRDPFQNEALVRLMLEMPVSVSFRDGTDKWVMREAMRGRIPEDLRTKGRTGLLNSFLKQGFERNREKLRCFLFMENTEWQAWVRPQFVRDVLDDRDASGRGQMVVCNCVGYSLWLKRLQEEGIAIG